MAKYDGYNLAQVLEEVLLAYPGVVTALDLLTDGMSPEYVAFHRESLKAHTGLIHFKHRGVVYQLSRVSNIRNTSGHERYTYAVWNDEHMQEDDPNIAYSIYIDEFLPWVTIRLT